MAENHSTNVAAIADELYLVVSQMLGLAPLLRGLADDTDESAPQLTLLAAAADQCTAAVNAAADRLDKMGREAT